MENNLNLKVVHTSPFPRDSFEYAVGDIVQAWILLNALSAYDEFQIAKGIRTDFSSTQGLVVWDAGDEEWVDYIAFEYLDTDVENITDLTLDELKALVNN
jgi:hypothetical protein